MFRPRRLLVLVYFVVGLIVAAQRDYLGDLNTARELISAVLAIVLWPLILLGFDIRIK